MKTNNKTSVSRRKVGFCALFVCFLVALYVFNPFVATDSTQQNDSPAQPTAQSPHSSSLRHDANSEAQHVHADSQYEAPRETRHLGDGCKHIFLDLGSNTGVQVRKLFESAKFPGSFLVNRFREFFGEDRREVCAFAFEPNPRHYPRLREIEGVYNSLGWRVHMFSAAVGTRNDTMYLTQPASYLQQAAQVTTRKPNRGDVIQVPVIDLVEFIRNHIASRRYLQKGGNSTGKVLVKMDIEGAEFAVLSALMTSGILCSLDVIYTEFHNHMSPGFLRSLNSPERSIQYSQILQMIVDASTTCKTRIERLDDESYGKDTILKNPLPLYKGAPPECAQQNAHCIMTKPLDGMSDELYRKSVLGMDVV